ncbi:MAG: hypothetical protein GXP35_06755 [Actinobacteria bacterium]|nr:hypothetical protein [Actinomycetota bacterium]
MRTRDVLAVAATLLLLTTSCTFGDSGATEDGDSVFADNDPLAAAQLTSAMAPLFGSEGPLPIDDETGVCIAAGLVDTIGVDQFATIGVTIDDPDGPDDDVYSGLSRDHLADAIAVWTLCADVPALVKSALVQTGPEELDAGVETCLELGLATGLAQRFLFDALADDTDPGGAVSDVLRLVDGCAQGGEAPELAEIHPGLWPWLTVGIPGYDTALVDADDPDASALAEFLVAGGIQTDGVALAALEVTTLDGELAAALIVVAVEPGAAGGISAASYSAGVVASAGDAEVFPIALPGGAEVLGWQEPDAEVVSLLWSGARIVVLATGPEVAADVLALYTELVPSP